MTKAPVVEPSPLRPVPPTPASPTATWRMMLLVHAELIEILEREFRQRHEMSVSEFDVLVNLGAREQVRHMELVGRVILTRTALTRLLDRLEARGWVSRTPAADDQRGVLIALTEEGRRVRRAAVRTNTATVDGFFSALLPAESEILGALVTRLYSRHQNRSTDDDEEAAGRARGQR